MQTKNDFSLTIEEVSQRLNKSTRTIHRYKDSGKLAFVVGATQGNPLYFSRSEVETLARELYPSFKPASQAADPEFWHRLERLESLLTVLQTNPMLEKVVSMARSLPPEAQNAEIEDALQQLAALEADGRPASGHELGRALVRLGSALLNS
jgi:hypothetical protein